MQDLTTKQLSQLRSRAHPLEPKLKLGKRGDSEGLRRELDALLAREELVKVRLGKAVQIDLAALAEGLGAVVVQRVGRTAVFYREKTTPAG